MEAGTTKRDKNPPQMKMMRMIKFFVIINRFFDMGRILFCSFLYPKSTKRLCDIINTRYVTYIHHRVLSERRIGKFNDARLHEEIFNVNYINLADFL